MGDSAHTTHHTNPGEKSAPPPFFPKMRTFFQKSGSMVVVLLQFRLQTWRPIFEKSSHLREKGGMLMLFKMTHQL
jgi:hypothetical protein